MSKNERSYEEFAIFVGNLSEEVTKNELTGLFSSFGQVTKSQINYDWTNGTFTIMKANRSNVDWCSLRQDKAWKER